MIKIIDNFLTPSYADAIHYICLREMRYVYTPRTSVKYEESDPDIFFDDNTFDTGQMVSVLYQPEGPFETQYNELKPMVYTLQDKVPELIIQGVIRVKANILTRNVQMLDSNHNIAHQDATEGCWTMLYYVNDSDGDTFMFNEHYSRNGLPDKLTINQRVTPKKNRAVIFNSSRYHASSNPVINQERLVLNFVLKAEYAGN